MLVSANRRFFTAANGHDSIPRDPETDEIVSNRSCTPFTEGEVVLVGATIVTMTFYRHPCARPAPHPIGVT